MRLKVEKNELMRGINVVQKAIPSKSVMPILKGILIIAEYNSLRLVANDMQLGIEISIAAEVIEPGSVVIDSRIFGDIIRKIRDEYIELTVDENSSIEINCSNLRMKIVGFDSRDFPKLPYTEEESNILINERIFSEMIKQTVFAVSKAEHLQVITGVLIEVCNNEIITAATDGYRFALRKYDFKNEQNVTAKIIIPGNSLMEIGRLLVSDKDRLIKLSFEEKYCIFSLDDIKIVSRLLQGNFINHNGIMPQTYESEIQINTKDLLYALEITSIFASNSNTGVRFDISDHKLQITSNADIGNIVKEIKITLNGRDIQIAFNINYIIEALKVIDEEAIKMCFSKGSNSPAVIKPTSNIKYEYLILPIRINNNIMPEGRISN